MPHTMNRRAVAAAIGAAAVAIPAACLASPAAVQHGQTTRDLMRAFIRKLLTERSDLTGGEWIHRKIVARGLQALIGDVVEPWEPWEASLLAEMKQTRQGSAWEGRS